MKKVTTLLLLSALVMGPVSINVASAQTQPINFERISNLLDTLFGQVLGDSTEVFSDVVDSKKSRPASIETIKNKIDVYKTLQAETKKDSVQSSTPVKNTVPVATTPRPRPVGADVAIYNIYKTTPMASTPDTPAQARALIGLGLCSRNAMACEDAGESNCGGFFRWCMDIMNP